METAEQTLWLCRCSHSVLGVWVVSPLGCCDWNCCEHSSESLLWTWVLAYCVFSYDRYKQFSEVVVLIYMPPDSASHFSVLFNMWYCYTLYLFLMMPFPSWLMMLGIFLYAYWSLYYSLVKCQFKSFTVFLIELLFLICRHYFLRYRSFFV